MTPNELVTLQFLARDVTWSFAAVAGLVAPWLVASRRLRIPQVPDAPLKPKTLEALPHRASRSRGRRQPNRQGSYPSRKGPQAAATGATSGKASRVLASTSAPDTAVIDAVLACQQLGFAKRDALATVAGFRAQLPNATCNELVRRALGAMSQGKSRRLP